MGLQDQFPGVPGNLTVANQMLSEEREANAALRALCKRQNAVIEMYPCDKCETGGHADAGCYKQEVLAAYKDLMGKDA